MLLNRKLTGDPNQQDFVGDHESSAMISRIKRPGIEIETISIHNDYR
jgi:hypothetical protein